YPGARRQPPARSRDRSTNSNNQAIHSTCLFFPLHSRLYSLDITLLLKTSLPRRLTMFQNELTYIFEEIPLDIGTPKEAQNIALISGEVDVSYAGVWCDDGRRGHEYEIEAVRLSGPILHDPDVAIGIT